MAIYFAIEEYISAQIESVSESLLIICPFIKVATLSRLLNRVPEQVKITIITTWKLKNFVAGVSDVEIFNFCNNRGIRLLINNRIHLKIWSIDSSKFLITSANITDSALGASITPNYEVLTEIVPSTQDWNAVAEITQASCPISNDIYLQTVNLLADIKKPEIEDVELICSEVVIENLVEMLPLSFDPQTLFELYSGVEANYSEEVKHDLGCLRIPQSLTSSAFKLAVDRSYFRLPIVNRVCKRLAEAPMYFGEMKAFLQEINDTDPKPTRRELTPITQNLYRWLSNLRPEFFIVDQPNHSERVTMTAGTTVI